MTVVVAFLCTDGAVIAADSMLTPSMGGLATGHHNARKVFILPGDQILAYAGDQGQAHRFRLFAEIRAPFLTQADLAYDVVSNLSSAVQQDFALTRIDKSINTNTVLAFRHKRQVHLCAFLGPLQPMLLDSEHFHVAIGSGKQMADPFLSFLVDTFGPRQPTVREAVFLASWVLIHVIRTNPGGVAGPVRIAVLPADPADGPARELDDDEKAEQEQAIEAASQALKSWRDTMSGNAPPSSGTMPPPAG